MILDSGLHFWATLYNAIISLMACKEIPNDFHRFFHPVPLGFGPGLERPDLESKPEFLVDRGPLAAMPTYRLQQPACPDQYWSVASRDQYVLNKTDINGRSLAPHFDSVCVYTRGNIDVNLSTIQPPCWRYTAVYRRKLTYVLKLMCVELYAGRK